MKQIYLEIFGFSFCVQCIRIGLPNLIPAQHVYTVIQKKKRYSPQFSSSQLGLSPLANNRDSPFPRPAIAILFSCSLAMIQHENFIIKEENKRILECHGKKLLASNTYKSD